jgi:HK97 family phage prohead protease
VYEVLEPGCISRELLQKSDVVLNLNHSNMVPDVLGRYRNNPDKDTLSLELRGDGIDCRCDLPRTNNANDALELIRRGDIDGMSFAFEDDYEDTEKGVSYELTKDMEDGKEVGFALFFHNFSTFLGRSGIYLEDLYVKPEYRSRGYGKGLLKQLAKIAVERGCGRLEWWCLDWNQPSIDFYLSLGAEPMEDWTVYRIAGKTLTELAL